MDTPDYPAWERRLRAWATTRLDLWAIVIVGARARREPPPSVWSDLDLILYTTEPDSYLSDSAWLAQLGEVWTAALGATSHDPEWLVLFGDGAKVDLVIARLPAGATRVQDIVAVSPSQGVLADGVRVLVDRLPASVAPVRAPVAQPPTPPTQAQFCHSVHSLWLEAARAAHYLARDDLWRAQGTLNGPLRSQLLTILEWHAVSQGRRPWPGGRRLAEWVDRATLAALPATFAPYDRAAVWGALLTTVDLYARLSDEAAAHLGYTCDARGLAVRAWLEEMFRNGGSSRRGPGTNPHA